MGKLVTYVLIAFESVRLDCRDQLSTETAINYLHSAAYSGDSSYLVLLDPSAAFGTADLSIHL